MTRLAASALALLLAVSATPGCGGRGTAQLQQANEALSTDVRHLEQELADLRERLERTRNAIDQAQDQIDAAQNELEQLPDSASEVADNAAARLDEAADALDEATDAADGDDGEELAAPVMVRTDLISRAMRSSRSDSALHHAARRASKARSSATASYRARKSSARWEPTAN